jgi:hypothetical protein
MNLPMVFFLSILLVATAVDDREAGFVSLADATDPASAFEFVGIDAGSVVFADGEIRLAGKPRGYLATKVAHTDFTLRFEWKYDLPDGVEPDAFDGNSGILLRIAGPGKVWPMSLQFQLAPDDPGDLFGLESSFVGKIDPQAQRKAVKPPDKWNEGEVELKGDRIVSRINGVEIASGTYPAKAGPIGLQSQGSPIRFRKVRIKLAR